MADGCFKCGAVWPDDAMEQGKWSKVDTSEGIMCPACLQTWLAEREERWRDTHDITTESLREAAGGSLADPDGHVREAGDPVEPEHITKGPKARPVRLFLNLDAPEFREAVESAVLDAIRREAPALLDKYLAEAIDKKVARLSDRAVERMAAEKIDTLVRGVINAGASFGTESMFNKELRKVVADEIRRKLS